MFRNCVAVLNISSTKLTLTVCERSVNGTFMLRANEEVECYTFFEGEFYDVKSFEEGVATLYKKLIDNRDESKKTHRIVPGEEDPGGEVKEC